MVYDLLRPFRRLLPRLAPWLDLGFGLAAFAAAFLFLLRAAEGELRGFAVLGAGGGTVVYGGLFSHALEPVWQFWADTLACTAKFLSLPLVRAKIFCKKLARKGKKLFYFAGKCYTIGKTGRLRAFRRGGGRHGKAKAGAAPHGPDDQAADPGVAGRHRLSAVRSARPGGKGPGRKGAVRRPGGGPASGE
ncbi:MAG: hypothetical protein IJ221_00970 [Oscillibacter sp.]|nr:hypothetical protein [Oscillibacter sp.]